MAYWQPLFYLFIPLCFCIKVHNSANDFKLLILQYRNQISQLYFNSKCIVNDAYLKVFKVIGPVVEICFIPQNLAIKLGKDVAQCSLFAYSNIKKVTINANSVNKKMHL